jgi:ribosomal protein S27E
MSRRPSDAVRTVCLPSGRTLEIVYPHGGDPFTRLATDAPAVDRDLEVCERCRSELVEPTRWEAAAGDSWLLTLRCPDCGHVAEGVFSEECVDRYDVRLDDAAAVMIHDLKRLQHANMIEDVERFVAALAADAILPEDFHR